MRMQDGPALDGKSLDILHKKSEPKGERNEELLALAWHESDIEPPNGAHIVFIDESGIVDDDEYINGRLKSGYTDWDEVLLWTMHPDDPSPTKAASLPEWLPLDAEHWPEEGALVVLSDRAGRQCLSDGAVRRQRKRPVPVRFNRRGDLRTRGCGLQM